LNRCRTGSSTLGVGPQSRRRANAKPTVVNQSSSDLAPIPCQRPSICAYPVITVWLPEDTTPPSTAKTRHTAPLLDRFFRDGFLDLTWLLYTTVCTPPTSSSGRSLYVDPVHFFPCCLSLVTVTPPDRLVCIVRLDTGWRFALSPGFHYLQNNTPGLHIGFFIGRKRRHGVSFVTRRWHWFTPSHPFRLRRGHHIFSIGHKQCTKFFLSSHGPPSSAISQKVIPSVDHRSRIFSIRSIYGDSSIAQNQNYVLSIVMTKAPQQL
jgi:hypothetical protein